MNLQEQLGALEASVDQINELTRHAQAALATAAERDPAPPASAPAADAEEEEEEEEATLSVSRPSPNTIGLSIGSRTVTLQPEQIGRLIEELAHARASMSPEPPMAIAPGWRFASTKNPLMAVQKQPNGDRLLMARHTGYGWVPFTLSPDVVIQLYMLLSK